MDESQQENTSRVTIWRSIIKGDQKSWILFEHGTCLILMKPEADLTTQAYQIMTTWGPVEEGTPAGDFNVVPLQGPPGGWIVTGHHPDMLNYVSPADVTGPNPSSLVIGLLGRANRDQDAHSLKIMHREDKRFKS